MIFLIEYAKSCFVNGCEITHLYVSNDRVVFTLKGRDSDSCYVVDKDKESMFLNHLQAINDNLVNVQTYHRELKEQQK